MFLPLALCALPQAITELFVGARASYFRHVVNSHRLADDRVPYCLASCLSNLRLAALLCVVLPLPVLYSAVSLGLR